MILSDAKAEFTGEWLTKAIYANCDHNGYPVSTSMTRQLVARGPRDPHGNRNARKPVKMSRLAGSTTLRSAARQRRGPQSKLPPRITRCSPLPGPIGSLAGLLRQKSSPYQSWQNSLAFPCMSCKPNALGGNWPTGPVP